MYKFKDFAKELKINPSKLGYVVFKLPSNKLYKTFFISKKDGGKREISAPSVGLKNIQYTIKRWLEQKYTAQSGVYGFLEGKNIIDNAKRHLNKKWILNVDIKDFFISINIKRIYGVLISKPFLFNTKKASYIAKLVTNNGVLAPGSPTSPIISNIICFRLDRALNKYASQRNVTYTRYVDDITFSSDELSSQKFYNTRKKEVDPKLLEIFENNGFELNNKKIRFAFNHQHQEVTGIVVNEKLNVKKFYKYKIRSMLNVLRKYTKDEIAKGYNDKNKTNYDFENAYNRFINELVGHISFLKSFGNDFLFYYKTAIKYNEITKRRRFDVRFQHSKSDVVEKSVFTLEKFTKEPGQEAIYEHSGVAFYSNDKFYTCLHNIIDYKKIDKNYDFMTRKMIEKELEGIELHNINFGTIKLTEHDVDFNYCVDRDLIIFSISDFYNEYSFITNVGETDRRKRYVLAYTLQENHEVITKDKIRIFEERLLNGVEGFYPISYTIEQGMSGSPILNKENMVVGMVTHGIKENAKVIGDLKNRIILI